MFTRSPSWNGVLLGIPWAAVSFMDMQVAAGNPTVGGAGFTPAFRIILSARAFRRSPFSPGRTSAISVLRIFRAWAPSHWSCCFCSSVVTIIVTGS